MKQILFAFFLTLSTLLGGCATMQDQNVRYMPGQNHGQYGVGNNENEQLAAMQCPGLLLTKRQDNLQTLLCLGNEVATETPLGTEILETFYGQDWSQVTHADAGNQTEIDVLCRLGALGETVSAQCLSDSNVAPAKSTGSIKINEVTVARVGGIERARNAVVGLVDRQRILVVNEAVRKRQSQYRRR